MRKTYTKQMVLSEHLNRHGNLFGGQMMSWMDIASAIHAAKTMNMNCVTVKVSEILFKVLVTLGDIVTFECSELNRGNTSLTIHIIATKNNLEEKDVEVATADFTFVAIDKEGQPSNEWNNKNNSL